MSCYMCGGAGVFYARCLAVVVRWLGLRAICSASCNGVRLRKGTEGNVSENIPFSTSALLVIGQA